MNKFLSYFTDYFKRVCDHYVKDPCIATEFQVKYCIAIQGEEARSQMLSGVPKQIINLLKDVLFWTYSDNNTKTFLKEYTEFFGTHPEERIKAMN